MYEMIEGSITYVFIGAFLAFNVFGLALVTFKLWRVNRALKRSGYADNQVAGTFSILAQMTALYLLLAGLLAPNLAFSNIFAAIIEQVAQFIVVSRASLHALGHISSTLR